MKSYEYPRVHPPSSLLPPQRPADNRFSWMDTTAAEEHRMWTKNTRRQRGTSTATTAPPVSVSQPAQEIHLQHMPVMDSQNTAGGAYPHQAQYVTPVHQQQYVPDPRQTSPAVVQPQYAHTTQIPQIPQEQQNPALPAEQKVNLPPQIPEPVKQPPAPQYEPPSKIGPDENPLSPTTPKFGRASTNMAIVPPSDISQYSIGTFTPTPQAVRGGSWQHSLCSCAEPSICLTAFFCPCIIYGRTQYRLGLRGEKKDPTNMLGYTAINGSCIAFGVLCGINGILAAIQHTRIRKAYNMNSEAGNVAGDCVTGLCCCCCVVAQDEKEVKFREEQGRKPAGSKKEGYVAPTAMSFSPGS